MRGGTDGAVRQHQRLEAVEMRADDQEQYAGRYDEHKLRGRVRYSIQAETKQHAMGLYGPAKSIVDHLREDAVVSGELLRLVERGNNQPCVGHELETATDKQSARANITRAMGEVE